MVDSFVSIKVVTEKTGNGGLLTPLIFQKRSTVIKHLGAVLNGSRKTRYVNDVSWFATIEKRVPNAVGRTVGKIFVLPCKLRFERERQGWSDQANRSGGQNGKHTLEDRIRICVGVDPTSLISKSSNPAAETPQRAVTFVSTSPIKQCRFLASTR